MNKDDKSGIKAVDDDGDGNVDDGVDKNDDDESGMLNEDPLNGLDDEGDGNVDEDIPADANGDGLSGIAGMDDNGDGTVDNGNNMDDDDEDGTSDEDPMDEVIFHIPSGTKLEEWHLASEDNYELSTRVTMFQVTYEAPERLLIELELTDEDGEKAEFLEYVYVTNVYQRFGKRVR